MSVGQFVDVKTHYTRSVNLERDASSVDVVKAYIPTSRALRTFERVATAFQPGQSPRAWSLVGPYGSGKSSYSVFLSQLLSPPSDPAAKAANKVLKETDANLASQFSKEIRGSEGYLKVLFTGGPEPMSKRLLQSFALAAQSYWNQRKGKKPKILAKLAEAALDENITTSAIIDLIAELQNQLEKTNINGILLVIDELGKFLEYEARHYGANDIFLLQALAEHACAGSKVNLLMFVLLHQSFDQYAKGLGEKLKTEWSKVQGRFEEVPFLESAEQVLRIVGAAFDHHFEAKDAKRLHKNTKDIVKQLQDQQALPGALSVTEATQLFESCYPLHPVSAILLPALCQKVAQNERTLFSYLGSHEDFGLQDMLTQLTSVNDYVYPHQIFDYFITNQPAVMGDYMIHRRWAEVVTAIERLGDANAFDLSVLKTIGILNIIGSKAGFKASKQLLQSCFGDEKAFTKAIKSLADKSVINYRRYNNEYRVWQGSDFDLESALQEELNNLGEFSLASELNAHRQMLPIVARRYTIESGALRYFVPTFVDAQTFKNTPVKSDDARIIFYLALGQDDELAFRTEVNSHFGELDIVVLCLSGGQLREAVAEALALRRVQTNCHELNTDPIAKREFEDRLTAAEQQESLLLQNLIDHPAESEWWHHSEERRINNKRQLQIFLSDVLSSVYHKAPRIFNELINRDRLSSQATAARNKLLYMMLNHADVSELAIEKFPPEKAIYRAVLRESAIHQDVNLNSWQFKDPPTDGRSDKTNMRFVWARINKFLDGTENEAKSFIELNQELLAPPYGVKAGVLPVLYIAVYMVYQHELAIYENRRYCPELTEEMLERFVKRPDEFTIQRFRIEGLKESIFKQYAQVIHGDTKTRTLLELARPLATFMGSLPSYTQKTRRGLSKNASAVRSAFNLAKSPEKLLFEQLPNKLGYENLDSAKDDSVLEGFAQKLTESLRELRTAHEKLLLKERQLLAQAFNLDPKLPLAELRKVVAGHCHGLENYTVDTQGLRAFIMRLTKATGDDEAWFENVLMFLGHKPSEKWLDEDVDTAEYRLTDLSRSVTDLEKLRLHEKDRQTQLSGDFDVYLLRSVKKGGDFQDEVVAVDEQSAKHISEVKQDIQNALGKLADKELMLAALASSVDEFLLDYKEQNVTKAEKKSKKAKVKSKSKTMLAT